MADFYVTVSGASVLVEPWGDPASSTKPSRIYPLPGLPPLRTKSTVNTAITLTAIVGGVSGPADGALGGRLFSAFVVEGPAITGFTFTPGTTSVQTFTPTLAGHWVVKMMRDQGGQVLCHVDVK